MGGLLPLRGGADGVVPLSAAAQVLETAAVRGRVVRADGSPLAAMRLVLRPLEGAGGSRQGNAVTVLTSRRGEFTVLGLLPGEYRVEVGWPAPWLDHRGRAAWRCREVRLRRWNCG